MRFKASTQIERVVDAMKKDRNSHIYMRDQKGKIADKIQVQVKENLLGQL